MTEYRTLRTMDSFWDELSWSERRNSMDVLAEVQRNEKYIEVLKKRNSKLLAELFEAAAKGSKTNRQVRLLDKEHLILKKLGGRRIGL